MSRHCSSHSSSARALSPPALDVDRQPRPLHERSHGLGRGDAADELRELSEMGLPPEALLQRAAQAAAGEGRTGSEATAFFAGDAHDDDSRDASGYVTLRLTRA